MSKDFEIKREPLGEMLRAYRKEKGYTQQYVAAFLGLERSTYAKYELDRTPELNTLIQLATLYEKTFDEFIGPYSDSVTRLFGADSLCAAANPDEKTDGTCLTRDELTLLSVYRKSIRKKEIIETARRIAAEDSSTQKK